MWIVISIRQNVIEAEYINGNSFSYENLEIKLDGITIWFYNRWKCKLVKIITFKLLITYLPAVLKVRTKLAFKFYKITIYIPWIVFLYQQMWNGDIFHSV